MEQLLFTVQQLNGAYNFQHVCKPKGVYTLNVNHMTMNIFFLVQSINFPIAIYTTQLL